MSVRFLLSVSRLFDRVSSVLTVVLSVTGLRYVTTQYMYCTVPVAVEPHCTERLISLRETRITARAPDGYCRASPIPDKSAHARVPGPAGLSFCEHRTDPSPLLAVLGKAHPSALNRFLAAQYHASSVDPLLRVVESSLHWLHRGYMNGPCELVKAPFPCV